MKAINQQRNLLFSHFKRFSYPLGKHHNLNGATVLHVTRGWPRPVHDLGRFPAVAKQQAKTEGWCGPTE